jgi:hypothetical protein
LQRIDKRLRYNAANGTITMQKRNVHMKANSIVIEQPQTLFVAVEIKGTAPLIQNKFNQKAVEEMLRKHMGLSVQKEKKVPAECVERATVMNADGKVCMPPTAFKKAMLTASTAIKSLKKTQLRTSVFVVGSSIPLEYSRMIPRMDMVRCSGIGRVPDVRFRPSFEDWSARMIIEFSETLPPQTVVDLLNRAGAVGVGEWRPEKDGSFGTFYISRNITETKEIKEVRRECAVIIPPLVIPEWAMNAELTPEILQRLSGGNSEDGE